MKKFETLEEAQNAFDSLDVNHTQLQDNHKTLNSAKVTVDKENADLVKKNKSLLADNKEQSEIIASIRGSVTIGDKPAFKNKAGVWDVDVKSTSWNGKIITAAQICEDKNLQDELIKADVGFIKLRTEE